MADLRDHAIVDRIIGHRSDAGGRAARHARADRNAENFGVVAGRDRNHTACRSERHVVDDGVMAGVDIVDHKGGADIALAGLDETSHGEDRRAGRTARVKRGAGKVEPGIIDGNAAARQAAVSRKRRRGNEAVEAGAGSPRRFDRHVAGHGNSARHRGVAADCRNAGDVGEGSGVDAVDDDRCGDARRRIVAKPRRRRAGKDAALIEGKDRYRPVIGDRGIGKARRYREGARGIADLGIGQSDAERVAISASRAHIKRTAADADIGLLVGVDLH